MTSPTQADSSTEGALRDLFSQQSNLLTVPAKQPNDLIGEPLFILASTAQVNRKRFPIIASVAASVALALAFVGISRGSDQSDNSALSAGGTAENSESDSSDPAVVTTVPIPATTPKATDYASLLKPYRFDTKSVRLAADQIRLTYEGDTFDYSMTVYLGMDGNELEEPMDAGVFGFGELGTREKSNLRLEGNRDRVPVLVEFDFESDGTDWWASEIRTSFGESGTDWLRETGEFFRSPLGTTFTGDLMLDHLTMTELEVLAFKKPVACLVPKHALAVGFNEPYATIYTGFNIDYWREPATTELLLRLFDSASCTPSDIDGLDVEVNVVDPTVFGFDEIIDHEEVGVFGLQLDVKRAGGTRIEVLVRDSDGLVVAELTFTAQSHPVSDAELDDYLSYIESETAAED